MDYLFLIGRILFGGYFLMNAFLHFTKTRGYAGYAASKGIPAPTLAVVITGILLLIGGVSIITNRYTEWGLFSLIVFLVPVTFIMHAYWRVADPSTKAIEQIHFWKNLGLLGGVLIIFSLL